MIRLVMKNASSALVSTIIVQPKSARCRSASRAMEEPLANTVLVADVIRLYTTHAVLAGFSQGICTAIMTMRRHPTWSVGWSELSGCLYDDDYPGDGQLAVMAVSGYGIPVFVGYDPADPRVPAVAISTRSPLRIRRWRSTPTRDGAQHLDARCHRCARFLHGSRASLGSCQVESGCSGCLPVGADEPGSGLPETAHSRTKTRQIVRRFHLSIITHFA